MALKNIIIQFEIPYHIQVKDSFKNNKNGRFYPVIEDIPAEIRFKSNVEDSGGIAIAGTAAGDRHGNLGYSSVQVWFDNQFIESMPEEFEDGPPAPDSLMFHMGPTTGETGYLIENAITYFNKFIQSYRHVSKFYWVKSLAPHEITRFQIVKKHEDGREETQTQFVTKSALKSGPLSDELLANIRRFTTQGLPEMLFYELILDAEDKIDRGEYNSAIVDSATMFEIWIKSVFEVVAQKNGFSEEEAKEMITKGGDSDEYLSPKNIIMDHFPSLGYELEKMDCFEDWDENTRKVRNMVVHEGYNANFKEARLAQNSAAEAVTQFSMELEDDLKDTKYMLYESTVNPLDMGREERI